MTAPLTLISFDLCPYVQRAAITLAEKGQAFERVTIDLANKPDWFLAISPLGKVPVLKVGDEVLFESGPIVEYLDEVYAPRLHPADPLAKARARAWMEVGSGLLGDFWTLEVTADEKAFEAARAAARAKLERVEAVLGQGPYFAGETFSIVDAVFAPAFRYLDTFERIAGLDLVAGLTKVKAWRAALAARPSVVNAVVPDYGARLEAFIHAKGGVLSKAAHAHA